MAEQPPIDVPKQVQLAFEKGKPVFYANAINGIATFHDIRLSFGKSSPLTGSEYDVHVYLPLTAAKQLAALVQGLVDGYEKEIGPIPVLPKETPQ